MNGKLYKLGEVVIKILQGSTVTQTVIGGLIIYPLVANFLLYYLPKNMKVGWQ